MRSRLGAIFLVSLGAVVLIACGDDGTGGSGGDGSGGAGGSKESGGGGAGGSGAAGGAGGEATGGGGGGPEPAEPTIDCSGDLLLHYECIYPPEPGWNMGRISRTRAVRGLEASVRD